MAATGSSIGAILVMRDDEEADAFFRVGDEGTYAGGPRSTAPVAVDDVDEDFALDVTTEQLERRDRLKRYVTTLVGTLGAGVMVLLPFKLGAFGAAAQKAAPAAVLPVLAHLAAPASPVVEPRANAVAATAPASVAPERQAATAQGAWRVAPRATKSVETRGAPASRKLAASTRAETARLTVASRRAARVLIPGGARHIPPTASFPD